LSCLRLAGGAAGCGVVIKGEIWLPSDAAALKKAGTGVTPPHHITEHEHGSLEFEATQSSDAEADPEQQGREALID